MNVFLVQQEGACSGRSLNLAVRRLANSYIEASVICLVRTALQGSPVLSVHIYIMWVTTYTLHVYFI